MRLYIDTPYFNVAQFASQLNASLKEKQYLDDSEERRGDVRLINRLPEGYQNEKDYILSVSNIINGCLRLLCLKEQKEVKEDAKATIGDKTSILESLVLSLGLIEGRLSVIEDDNSGLEYVASIKKLAALFLGQSAKKVSAQKELPEKSLEAPQPLAITHKLAAQFLGGAFISKALMEEAGIEKRLEGSDIQSVYRLALETLLALMNSFTLSEEVKKEIPSLMAAVVNALEIDRLCQNAPPMGSVAEESLKIAEQLQKRVTSGESCVLSGGWIGKPASRTEQAEPGHSIIYEIIRQPDGKFTMRVFNTGAGVEYHLSAIIGTRLKNLPFLEQRDIDISALSRPEIWRAYYEHMYKTVADAEGYDEADIYERFLKSIHSNFGQDMRSHRWEPSAYVTPQTAGTCTADSLVAFFRHRLGSEKKFSALNTAMQLCILKRYFEGLRAGRILVDQPDPLISLQAIKNRLGAIRFLRKATAKLSAEVAKAIRRGWIGVKEGAEAQKFLSEVIHSARKSARIYHRQYVQAPFSVRTIAAGATRFTLPLAMSKEDAQKAKQASLAAKELKADPFSLLKAAIWPAEGAALKASLQSWVTFQHSGIRSLEFT